jgi:hypothetical protein
MIARAACDATPVTLTGVKLAKTRTRHTQHAGRRA